MWPKQPTLYSELRSAFASADAFHEGQEPPPEQLLQAVWQHQRLHRHNLRTATGLPVFILHPGFLNREAGPDFQKAVIQIGDKAARTGDIEIDTRAADWVHHKHENNPAYKNVVLHVVWRTTGSEPSPANLPLMELAPVLDAPLAELSIWLRQELPPKHPPFVEGHCAAPLGDLEPHQVETLLEQAALFRLKARAEHFKARAREAGWNQALWEGAFRALGYKHNPWPMLRLAELRQRWQQKGDSPNQVLARLLGLSGLLPPDLARAGSTSSKYVRQLWDSWWRERDSFADCLLPPKAWRLAGIRPTNHPQRRLALAAHWITEDNLPHKLRAWCDGSHKDSQLSDSLLKCLQPKADPYWSRHYTLRSGAAPKPLSLLGNDRTTDLAANVILPWLWARASQGRRTRVCREVEHRFLAWPGGSDTAVLKLARQRLLGTRHTRLPRRMSMQHGMLQIVRDYCDHSNSLCDHCRFPEVARRFKEL